MKRRHGDVPGDKLAITWVDILPGSGQKMHSHEPEQVYVIIKGKGRMQVDAEERDVTDGDLI